MSKTLTEWDEFVGRLASPESVEVRARVSGYLDKVHFKEGSEVKQGDLLFTIDPRPYQAITDRLAAEFDRAKARRQLATTEARRAEGLLRSRTIAAEEADQRIQGLAEAEATVRAAEAALGAAKLDLEFAQVRAPISGRISTAMVTVGNLVTGGNTASAVLTTIIALNPIYCYIDVDERSALKYRELFRQGKRTSALYEQIPAQMGLANQTGYPIEGVIDFVDNQLNPNTGAIRARGVFQNADGLMAPGFFARLRIPGSGEYTAMMVRDAAIGNDQGKAFVLLVGTDNKVVQRPVTTGPLEDGLRIVREGIKADDRIIISGLVGARSGSIVNVTEELPMQAPTLAAK